MDTVEVGQILAGKLLVEGVLGQGGMGVVLVARHIILGERVAVKLLRPRDPNVPRDPSHVERLHREARAAARLKGIHVARVMDVGTLDDGSPYIVMEHIDGQTLSGVLRDRGALPVDEVVELVLQVCEGLAEAHAQGIVHRDLKPSNLMLTSAVDGSPLVKILDFGIARAADGHQPTLTGSSVMLGSPSYMSPEQIRDAHDVDARTDLWSLGVTFYELLTRRLPFEAFTPAGLIARISVDPAAPPSDHLPGLDPELEQVVLRCLEKGLDQRFASVAELATALVPFASPRGAQSAERIARVLRSSLSDRSGEGATTAPLGRSGATPRTTARSTPRPTPLTVTPPVAQTFSQEAHTLSADGVGEPPASIASTAAAPPRGSSRSLLLALAVGVGSLVLLLARALQPTTGSPTTPVAATLTPPTGPGLASAVPTTTTPTAPTATATLAPPTVSSPPVVDPTARGPAASAHPAAGAPGAIETAARAPGPGRPPPARSASPAAPAPTPVAPEGKPAGFITDFGDRK